jgi:hypothetical protein
VYIPCLVSLDNAYGLGNTSMFFNANIFNSKSISF